MCNFWSKNIGFFTLERYFSLDNVSFLCQMETIFSTDRIFF